MSAAIQAPEGADETVERIMRSAQTLALAVHFKQPKSAQDTAREKLRDTIRAALAAQPADDIPTTTIPPNPDGFAADVQRFSAMSRPAPAEAHPTEEQWQRIGDLIEEAIRHHRLSAWRTEDDEPLGMFDLFYGGHQGQIDGVAANHEIDLLVDAIFDELKTGWAPQWRFPIISPRVRPRVRPR